MLIKCTVSAGLLISGSVGGRDAVWALSVSQLSYAVMLLLGYAIAWDRVIKRQANLTGGLIELLPASTSASTILTATTTTSTTTTSTTTTSTANRAQTLDSWLDAEQVRIAWSFSGQTVVKYLLTEGDKLVLTSLATRYHQGVYALVNNYGISIY
jgi:hypothetical protein